MQSKTAPEFFRLKIYFQILIKNYCITDSESSSHGGIFLRAGTPAVQTNPLIKIFPLTENGTPNKGFVDGS